MIWLYAIAALTGVMTMAFSILPSSEFLALPDAMYSALGTVAGWGGWALGLFGTEIKGTIVLAMTAYLAILIPLFLFDVLRRFSFPIVGRWINPK